MFEERPLHSPRDRGDGHRTSPHSFVRGRRVDRVPWMLTAALFFAALLPMRRLLITSRPRLARWCTMAADQSGPPSKNGNVEAIKNAASLVDVMSDYGVETEQVGNVLKARCPFHPGKESDGRESTPSMGLFGEGADQRYYCYACQAKGDVISFVMEHESIDFREAMQVLAKGYDVDLGKWSGSAAAAKPARPREDQILVDVHVEAAKFYQSVLRTPQGKPAAMMLRERGLTPSIRDVFGLGYAPASFNALTTHLQGKGFELSTLTQAGLSVLSPTGGAPRDFYQDRLMIPIHDADGEPVGFGGRIVPPLAGAAPPAPAEGTKKGWEAPKYINSPETRIFKKRELLYGDAYTPLLHPRTASHPYIPLLHPLPHALSTNSYHVQACTWRAMPRARRARSCSSRATWT